MTTVVETAPASRSRYRVRLLLLSAFLIAAYLLIAYVYHAPRGYYGTVDTPRFADPWIARSETILNGGLLYRDVFTATPPLTNLLLVIPSLVPIIFGNINPWATLSYMLFFSLFNIFTALVLLNMAGDRAKGFQAAVLFLLNPLTFGNTILRRQDESIVVFFIALALMFVIQERHTIASIAIGAAILVKISGAFLIPVVLIHYRNWRYLIIPPLVFLIVMAPFLLLAGSDAIFFNPSTDQGQHPFQFNGVSLGALWNQMQGETGQISLLPVSVAMIMVVGFVIIIIAWKRFGILQDMILLTTAVYIISPKLHTGYFSLLAMLMAPLIRNRAIAVLYLLFGAFAVVADFYKWPIADFRIAFWLMVVTLVMLLGLAITLGILPSSAKSQAKQA
jgi:Gpi18-like mannosyltransferase